MKQIFVVKSENPLNRLNLPTESRTDLVMTNYQDLQQEENSHRLARWQNWIAETDRLVAEILARREGQLIPVDELLRADRAELEGRVSDKK